MDIKRFILETLFPIRCIACDKYGAWICEKCLQEVKILPEQTCPACKKNFTANGELCFSCNGSVPLDGILIASLYREKKQKTLLAKAIHYYKYRFIPEIGISLGKILEKSLLRSSLPLPDIIIPVPLHRRRLRWRGFNQALIMARYLGENLTPAMEIAVSDEIILRRRHTRPQMEIKNKHRRKINVTDAFILNKDISKKISLKGKTVLLIDDVATTGSTLFECAKILKKNKVKKVYSAVLARQ